MKMTLVPSDFASDHPVHSTPQANNWWSIEWRNYDGTDECFLSTGSRDGGEEKRIDLDDPNHFQNVWMLFQYRDTDGILKELRKGLREGKESIPYG